MLPIPFYTPDLKKINNVFRPMFDGVEGFDTTNPDKLREHIARITGYATYHDLVAQTDRVEQTRRSVRRSEVKIALAISLAQNSGISVLDAYAKVQAAKTKLLTFDDQTLDREMDRLHQHYEEDLDRHPDANKAAKALREDQDAWHKDVQRLLSAGAPPYYLTVRKDGMAFDWISLIEKYDLVLTACKAPELVSSNQVEPFDGSDERLANFVSAHWTPIESLIAAGLMYPYHRLIWLFDKDGKALGQVLQHTVHGGIIPRVLLTNDDVGAAVKSLFLGEKVESRSVVAANAVVTGNDTVFTLDPNTSRPKFTRGSSGLLSVDKEVLVPVPGISAGHVLTIAGDAEHREWVLSGHEVRISAEDWDGTALCYLRTYEWLSERSLPMLYGQAPAGADANPSMGERSSALVLPPHAQTFTNQALDKLDAALGTRWMRALDAAKTGELIQRILDIVTTEQLEAFCAEKMQQRLGILSTKSDDAWRIAFRAKFPEMKQFGQFTCLMIALPMSDARESFNGDRNFELAAGLIEIVMLAALILHNGGGHHHRIKLDDKAMVVSTWLSGGLKLDRLHHQAVEVRRMRNRLNDNLLRTMKVEKALSDDDLCRDRGQDLMCAFVTRPVPLQKPQAYDPSALLYTLPR